MTPFPNIDDTLHISINPDQGVKTSKISHIRALQASRVIDEVCQQHKISHAVMYGASRKKDTATARRECYHKLYHQLGFTMPQIGQIMNRDHTTVSTGLRRYEDLKFYWNKRNENLQRNPG